MAQVVPLNYTILKYLSLCHVCVLRCWWNVALLDGQHCVGKNGTGTGAGDVMSSFLHATCSRLDRQPLCCSWSDLLLWFSLGVFRETAIFVDSLVCAAICRPFSLETQVRSLNSPVRCDESWPSSTSAFPFLVIGLLLHSLLNPHAAVTRRTVFFVDSSAEVKHTVTQKWCKALQY
jgi:hypothetical protein